MASLPTVAIAGATGSLGAVVLDKVLTAGFPVVVLTRQGSTSTSKLPVHKNQVIKEVDYSSRESIVAALKGSNVVVSTLAGAKVGDQEDLIDAALAAGTVTRFIPSDFGSDILHPKNVVLPVFRGKVATAKYLEEVAAKKPEFTYTSISNNAFLDWGLQTGGIFANPKAHTATLWDGGDRPFSVTTLATVGDAVVAVLNNLEATANKDVKIHDAVVTQKQLIELVKKIDGQEWKTTVKSTREIEEESYAELKKPDGNVGKAMLGFLVPAVLGEGREVYSDQVDNKLLGLKEMSNAEVEEVVRKVVQGL